MKAWRKPAPSRRLHAADSRRADNGGLTHPRARAPTGWGCGWLLTLTQKAPASSRSSGVTSKILYLPATRGSLRFLTGLDHTSAPPDVVDPAPPAVSPPARRLLPGVPSRTSPPVAGPRAFPRAFKASRTPPELLGPRSEPLRSFALRQASPRSTPDSTPSRPWGSSTSDTQVAPANERARRRGRRPSRHPDAPPARSQLLADGFAAGKKHTSAARPGDGEREAVRRSGEIRTPRSVGQWRALTHVAARGR